MKKQYTITLEINASTKENAQAFDALVADAFESLKKHVASLDDEITDRGDAPVAPAPAAADLSFLVMAPKAA